MLTADLVRVRFRKGRIYPQLIDVEDEDLQRRARRLCDLFAGHDGKPREELRESVKDLVGDETNFLVTRGMAKLLDDRSEWDTVAPVDPVELRQMLFEAAASEHPIGSSRSARHPVSRDDIILRVADQLGVTPSEVELGMYADLKSEQRLVSHRPMEPARLLQRYNLSLIQAVLLRAHEMTVEVEADRPSRLRELYRHLKFRQLMHRTSRDGDRWTLTIDGPVSLFQQSQRYGLQMALFFPAVLLLPKWKLTARVKWKRRGEVELELDHKSKLQTHLRSKGTYITEEEKILYHRINDGSSRWTARRSSTVIELDGQDVLVPDFSVKHEDGRRAHVEIIGYWRKTYLERRMEILREHGPSNLILCISRNLATDRSKLGDLGDNVVDFAQIISRKKVLEVAERVAE